MLSAITLALWVMALARTLHNLSAVRRLQRGAMPEQAPLLSVVIPARNEQRAIDATVRAHLLSTYPNFEVLVVDDRSEDGTAGILESLGDARLTVVRGEETPAGWLGKPWALHQGAQRARGSLLLFADADVHYEPEALGAAAAHLLRSDAALITLFPRMEMESFWERVLMPTLGLTLFAYLPLWLSNRTRWHRLAIGGGTGNLVRRDRYERAGGHQALKDAVVDDIALARLIRIHGDRTEAVRAEDLVSLRMYHGLREIVQGFTKNIFAACGRNYAVALALAVLGILLHVVPYFLALAGDRLAMATVVVISIIRVVLFRALGYGLANALFLHPLGVTVWTWILIRSTWMTGIRRQLEWRGRTYDAQKTRFGADR